MPSPFVSACSNAVSRPPGACMRYRQNMGPTRTVPGGLLRFAVDCPDDSTAGIFRAWDLMKL